MRVHPFGAVSKETFTGSDANLFQGVVSKLVGNVQVESMWEDSKVEIPSATQFKARSALLFLFIVLQECVYFVITRDSWDGQQCGMGQVKIKKLCRGSTFFLFFWSQCELQVRKATMRLISCS